MKRLGFLLAVCCVHFYCSAQEILSKTATPGGFSLVSGTQVAGIYVDAGEPVLVHKAAHLFSNDVEMVTGKKPALHSALTGIGAPVVIVGTVKSPVVQQLIKTKKIVVKELADKWEAYLVQVVSNPLPGIPRALVVCGSDRRGAAFGVFELSRQIGVSPWYWWADVPVQKKQQLHFTAGLRLQDAPKVKYRGIFINDEAPALSNWSREKFGGFNHKFYEKVFELILRNKANYLWPAMWGNAFYDDDPQNIKMADDYGVVIGTSHHEPLMRAHDEWRRYGTGKWNYDSNELRLKEFWRGGMQRATNEKIVSIGMRGDGDEPMTRETATALLERIVKDQREIIADVTGKPADQTPQLWALYKEVQDYYDKGMRVPDDVTLLLCDDNWGNIRKLPKLNEPKRKGGYGIYYHFDYVGGPRNYKWLNTNNLARVWEQMHMAWEYGARQIWIVNVGDIKPMELPISFFLDYAWDPSEISQDNLPAYYMKWAKQQFPQDNLSKPIGEILRTYAQISARRKPELLDANTYSLDHYREWPRVVSEWKQLEKKADSVAALLPEAYQSAYFQLVSHPVKAMSNLHDMYYHVVLNRDAYAKKFREANQYADEVKKLYVQDSMISLQYHQVNGGKWNHMMSQTHIGYTYWQQPPVNKMPAVSYVPGDSIMTTSMKLDTTEITYFKAIKPGAFFQRNNYVSIEAAHWNRTVGSNRIKWDVIPDIGRTGDGITTFPVTETMKLTSTSPRAEYDFYTMDTGRINIQLHFSPTLNYHSTEEGLLFAVSVDNQQPVIMSLNKEDKNSISGIWNSWVANNVIPKNSEHVISRPDRHTLKYWAISPGVVLQKVIIHFGRLDPSYLGPEETLFTLQKNKP